MILRIQVLEDPPIALSKFVNREIYMRERISDEIENSFMQNRSV